MPESSMPSAQVAQSRSAAYPARFVVRPAARGFLEEYALLGVGLFCVSAPGWLVNQIPFPQRLAAALQPTLEFDLSVIGALLAVVAVAQFLMGYRCQRWIIDGNDLYQIRLLVGGVWLSRETRQVRIAPGCSIHLQQSVLDLALNLGTLSLHRGGSSDEALTLRDVSDPHRVLAELERRHTAAALT